VANPIPLEYESHKNMRVVTDPGEQFGDNINLIAVVPREFTRLIANYPIVIAKDVNSGEFNFCVLTGFEKGENLFLEGTHWDASYIPLEMQRRPFLAAMQEGTDKAVVYVDADDPRAQGDSGERIFEDSGEQTEYFRKVNGVLADLVVGIQEARRLMAALLEHDLVEPVRFNIKVSGGQDGQFDGLYAINDEKVAALEGDALAEFHAQGYLRMIHVQLASLVHIQSLIDRKNRRVLAKGA